ncbi:MAG: hypothetical protein WDZ51_09415 [Pirellulaceae bacterium]
MLKRSLLALLLVVGFFTGLRGEEPTLRVAVFQADATPEIGTPVAYAATRSIQDPLFAKGIVILGSGKPIVLCAVDWIGIGNGGYDAWREKLAAAAGTTPDRVSVHCLHQHDGPRCDFDAEELLAEHGLGGDFFDLLFNRQTIEATSAAIREALKSPQPVTHLGIGQAKVEKVASNRRVLGEDGKVAIIRWSRTTDPAASAAPEGLIDPLLRSISFWNEDQPVVCLTYYATHPQSYYGQGDVTSEFVGIAREKREAESGVPHIHFNGAGGNITAGKYNDGSKENRPVLTKRMETGMQKAWEATERRPISAAEVDWKMTQVQLPLAEHLSREAEEATLKNREIDPKQRLGAATNLAFILRREQQLPTELSRLSLGDVHLVHMPGELFIEYQLAAQKMVPKGTVCMAAYGDYGPGYIGTEISYTQGGYETSARATNVSPQVEKVLMDGLRELLE